MEKNKGMYCFHEEKYTENFGKKKFHGGIKPRVTVLCKSCGRVKSKFVRKSFKRKWTGIVKFK